MRVVVTGGSGMIGRSLAAELAGAGHDVLVTSRHPDGVAGLPGGVRVARWDTASAQELLELVEGAGAVVHLTGEGIGDGRWTAERKRRMRASRVGSTAALAQACTMARERPGVVVQASGIDYYGARRGDEVIGEESAPGEGFLSALCQDWEAASARIETLGMRRVLLRTGVVLSAAGGALPKMALPFRLFAGGPVAGGEQWVSWIHLEDEVGAIRFLIEEPAASGAYNLVAPGPVRNGAFSRALGRALRRPSLVPVPAIALRLLYGEMATLLVEGQRALPRRLQEAGYVFRHPDVGAALVDLLG